MGKELIIVESPTKARTIERILGDDFKVLSSNGHVIDLPKKDLAVDIDNGFALSNKVIPSKRKALTAISKAAAGADRVLLATDPDREGEAIAYLISLHLKLPPEKVARVMFHEITRQGIANALAAPGRPDENRFHAQQARRAIDRLVGYKLSPVLWQKIRRGLSAGRVQSVALRLVCEREKEIQAFVPEDYWMIFSTLDAGAPPEIRARLVSIDGDKDSVRKGRLSDGELAARAADELRGLAHVVRELTVKESKRSPKPPFITSTMQQEAARKLRFTAKRTMTIAQQLYEGVSMGQMGTMGLITYMRTDSVRVSAEAVNDARSFIAGQFGDGYLPPSPRGYRNRKGAQDAHEAVRPAQVEITPEKAAPFLDRDQARLYELIYKRFVASQMTDARIEKTRVAVQAGPYGLEVSGERVLFPGFTKLYEEGRDEAENGVPSLPALEQGQELNLLDVKVEKKATQPPPRYTEATLVKTLEEKGIGRPSTYAAILDTIQKRNYVTKEDRRFTPTFLGMGVNDYLVSRFQRLVDVGFTATLEDELDGVEEGDKSYLEVLNAFYEPFSRELDEAANNDEDYSWGQVDNLCPECGKNLQVKSGKTGEFLACTGYPECRFTSNFTRRQDGKLELEKQEERPETCPECGSPMVLRQGKGGPFLGCSTYPDCKGTMPLSTGVPCPEEGCTGEMVVKRTRKGRIFYGCSAFPKCRHALWDEPVAQPCPQCGHPLMTRKSMRGDNYLVCPVKECGHRMPEPPAD